VLPGAGWAAGVFDGGVLDEGVFEGGVFEGGVFDGVDCAHAVTANASANPASTAAWQLPRTVFIPNLQHNSILAMPRSKKALRCWGCNLY
jgi:hypothetical protein